MIFVYGQVCLFFILCNVWGSQTIHVGAKNFNEGYLLAEIISQLLEQHAYTVERKYNLGGTLICFEALKNNEIQIYPEYSGTIAQQVLKSNNRLNLSKIRKYLFEHYKLEISEPYGFNNTYALALKAATAKKMNLQRISDLRKYEELKFAFSHEFVKRQDGWINLSLRYNLSQIPVGIEHGLAYQAIDEGKVDLIDVYSTDGEIPRYNLKLLQDDLNFFPLYQAVSFYRSELDTTIKQILANLNFSLDEHEMQVLNARVVFEKESYYDVARSFLADRQLLRSWSTADSPGFLSEIFSKTLTHLWITIIALLAAIFLAVPVGMFIYNYEIIARPLLYLTGLLQTIPSIALLAFMIPLFGIGAIPAVIALFIYALLPILRNTTAALFSIDPLLKKVAVGIGLSHWQRLRHIEIPLAVPMILAGIKTAAVINIGTATLAAFIGAGGLGEFIVTGLALNNTAMILKGAIPAALLAIVVEFLFEALERVVVPQHLRQKMVK